MTTKPPAPAHDWHLKAWLDHAGRKQAAIAVDLDWERSRVSRLVNGVQPYSRADVNALAQWLGIEPYELLMPPEEALAIRRLRQAAHLIAAEDRGREFSHAPLAGTRK